MRVAGVGTSDGGGFQRSVGYLCNEILMECVRVTLVLLAEAGNPQCRRNICVVITVI